MYSGKPITAFTKWCPDIGLKGPDACKAAIDLACKRMNTKSIDLLQYHIWRYDDIGYM